MTKAEFLDLLARRAGKSRTQLQRVLDRLHADGALRLTTARRTPPDIYGVDAALILLSALVGADDATTAANLCNAASQRLLDVVTMLFEGPPRRLDTCIVRQDGASITVDGVHHQFGNPDAAGPAGFISGAVLSAIIAEYRGTPADEAEAVAALTQLRGI